MYLVTFQPKKQGAGEPKQIICDSSNLAECVYSELHDVDDVVAIIAYIKQY